MESLGNITKGANIGGMGRVIDRKSLPAGSENAAYKPRDMVQVGVKNPDMGIMTPDQAQALKSRVLSGRAGDIKEAASAMLGVESRINANLNGWVGKNSASLSINGSGNWTDINGHVGGTYINIHENQFGNGSNISGSFSGGSGGHKSLSLHVDGMDGHRTMSGWVGNEYMTVRENRFGDATNIQGRIGDRRIDLRCSDRNNFIDIDGDIRDPRDFNNSLLVNVSGSQFNSQDPLSFFALIPALTIGG